MVSQVCILIFQLLLFFLTVEFPDVLRILTILKLQAGVALESTQSYLCVNWSLGYFGMNTVLLAMSW